MIDHTVNRVFFVGLMGGLLLLAILFVPLYFIVPSFYIPDWNSIEFQDLWAMSILATLGAFGILLGSGWIGARFGRASTIAQRLTFGAVAGCVSATVAYLGIGSAAMSVIGAQNIIEYGYQPAANDDHMMSLLYESVGGILIWGHIGLWVVFILGIGIGALGGLLHRNQPNELDSQALRSSRNQVLSWSIVSAGLNLPVGYLAYATLFETIRDDADQYEISQWAMLGSLLAIVTMFAIFMIPLVLALWFHRQDFRAGHYLDAFYGGTSAGAVAVIASWFMLSGETLSLNTILGSVIWGIGMLLLGSARRTAQTEMVKAQAHKMRLLIILASFFLITPLIILIFWGWTSMLFTNLALIAGMFGGELLKSQKRILWSGVGMISLVSFGFMAGGLPLFASIGLFSLAGILVRDIVVVFQDSKDEPIVFVNKSVWESHLGSLLGSTTVLVINSALVVITALPLVLIVVGVLPVLIPNDNETTYESSTTMLETVQAFYLIQAQSILIMFFVGLGIMGIVTLVMYAVRRWQKRSSLRQKGLVYDTSRVSG